MINSLIDAGPLIALFDRDDAYHNVVKTFLAKHFRGRLYSTWPVITEASHLLKFNIRVQIDFYKWIDRGALEIVNIESENFKRLITLSEKYQNVPMDLADGTLLVLSEISGIREILTLDSDYYVYRTRDKKMLKNLLEPFLPIKRPD